MPYISAHNFRYARKQEFEWMLHYLPCNTYFGTMQLQRAMLQEYHELNALIWSHHRIKLHYNSIILPKHQQKQQLASLTHSPNNQNQATSFVNLIKMHCITTWCISSEELMKESGKIISKIDSLGPQNRLDTVWYWIQMKKRNGLLQPPPSTETLRNQVKTRK